MRAIILFFLAIALGVGGGFVLNGYVERILFEALDDEVRASTPCHLVSKTWDVSLLTLSADARDVRMVCLDGSNPLVIPKITARFSLKKIWQKKVVIAPLVLHQGAAQGLFPGSAPYDFIARLAAPETIEQRNRDKFRVRLEKLIVKGPSLQHTFKSGNILSFEHGDLTLTRAEDDTVTLIPALTKGKIGNTLIADHIKATIISTDFDSKISDLSIDGPLINFNGGISIALTGKEAMTGGGDAVLSLSPLLPSSSGSISSTLSLSGSALDDISLSSSMNSDNASVLNTPLSPLIGTASVVFKEKGDIHAQSPRTSLQDNKILIENSSFDIGTDDALNGESSVAIQQAELSGFQIEQGKFGVRVSGDTEDPSIAINGNIESLTRSGLTLKQANLQLSANSKNITASLSTADKTMNASYSKVQNDEKSSFQFSNFKPSDGISVTGKGALAFSDRSPIINFDGNILIGSTPLMVKAEGSFANLVANLSGKGISGSFKTKDGKGNVDFRAKDFLFAKCKTLSGDLNYNFSLDSPKLGSGAISNWSLIPGCGAGAVSLTPATPLSISNGAINFSGRKITALDTDITLSGVASLNDGLGIDFKGTADLSELLQGITSFDDLGGAVALEASVRGPFENPVIDGAISVKDGSLEIENLNISAENINGKALIANNALQAKGLTGNLNGGKINLEGLLPFSGNEPTQATASFEDVALEPSPEVSITTSGALTITPDPMQLTGSIRITQGEVRKTFNLKSLIATTLASIFKREIQYSTQSNIDLPLDLSVSIPNSILVETNLFEATLDGDLQVTGTIANPALKGTIKLNDGWVGLRGRRFDINVGEVSFPGPNLEPNLTLIGESLFLPSEQDSVSVLLQVSGPLSSPRVSLSSDRNLSNQQLLNIITGGTSETELTQINTRTGSVDATEDFSLQDTVPFLTLPSFLRNLTRIDSLSIDPRYDPFTGQYEPVVTARKNLAPFLDLVGESSWQGTKNSAGVKAVYNLTSRINVVGLARSVPTEDQTVFGVDVTWTLLARQATRTKIYIDGNHAIDDKGIYSAIGISPISETNVDSLPTLSARLNSAYENLGYRNAHVTLSCDEIDAIRCKSVHIQIDEGRISRISNVQTEGDSLPAGISFPSIDIGDPAANQTLIDKTQELTQKLRNEGFVGARIKSRYECAEFKCNMVTAITVGRPISFVFNGNKKFTAEDFLASIRLFSRKQPFGTNTASILQENIETLYKNAGFPFVEVQRDRNEDPSGRVIYTFTISEGTKPSVSEVTISGYEGSKDELIDLLKENSADPEKEIFGISEARDEVLNRAESLLKIAFERAGFENPEINRTIERNSEAKSVSIDFKLSNPQRMVTQELSVEGFPFSLPEKPKAPFSKRSINEYTKSLSEILEEHGYNESIITVTQASPTHTVLEVTSGPQLLLSSISIHGNVHIDESTVRDGLQLTVGEPISDAILRQAQINLMKQGLYQRVNITRNNSMVEVAIDEKPLTTLEVGGGYSSGLGVHLFGEASDKRLFGDGKSISLRLDGYVDSWDGSLGQGIVATRFTEPSLFKSPWGISSELSFQRQELATYEFDLNRLSLGTFLFRSWDNGLTLSTGYTALKEDLKNVAPDVILSSLDEGNVTLGYASGTVTYDTRDYALNPNSGRIISFDSMVADKSIGSDAQYFGTGGRITQYIPLFDRFSLVTGGQVGKRWVFGDTDAPPISQRYYLGGRGSIRGYKENSLGPRGVDGHVIGGDEILRANLELHYRLYDDVSIQTFLDAGKLSNEQVDSPLDEWVKGVGLGVRYLSPIGPIGLDFGHGLDDVPGSRNLRVTFDIGVSF